MLKHSSVRIERHAAPWNDDAGRGLRHALEPLSDQRGPMYEAPDYDSTQPWPYKDERDNDIAAKSRVISALSIMDTKQMSRNLGIHEQRLKHLHAAYAAAIIKRLKSLHLPDFGKKRQR